MQMYPSVWVRLRDVLATPWGQKKRFALAYSSSGIKLTLLYELSHDAEYRSHRK